VVAPTRRGTLTDIIGVHYAPASVIGAKWWVNGTAPTAPIGMDRTVATGTGFRLARYPARRRDL
jgi:hypothetical protein